MEKGPKRGDGRARWGLTTLGWVVVFVVVAIGIELYASWSARRTEAAGGADIGLGLILLALLVVLGLVAGGIDAWRSARYRPSPARLLVLRWVLVGLAAGLAAAVYRSIDDHRLSVPSILGNFAYSTAIETVLLTISGLATGLALRPAARSRKGS